MNKLTVLCWLAADTGVVTGDLRDAIRRDLEELREGARLAGETIAVLACYDDGQHDGLAWSEKCGESPSWQRSFDPNMANPHNLIAFCDWAMALFPAEQYALIVGSHGSGIKRQDVYRGDHIAEGSKKVSDALSPIPPSWTKPSIQEAKADIAYDDSSRQAMSVSDLGLVCRHIAERGPLAIVLLDACHMAEISVCEALAGSAEVLVASPEAIPAEGFPYTMLIDHWADVFTYPESFTGRSTAANLAIRAVDAFIEQYTAQDDVASILAVDLKGVPELLAKMDTVPWEWMQTWSKGAIRTSDPDFAYIGVMHQPIIDSWASVSAPDAGLTVFLPERGPLPRWWFSLPLASRPFGLMVRRIVEG